MPEGQKKNSAASATSAVRFSVSEPYSSGEPTNTGEPPGTTRSERFTLLSKEHYPCLGTFSARTAPGNPSPAARAEIPSGPSWKDWKTASFPARSIGFTPATATSTTRTTGRTPSPGPTTYPPRPTTPTSVTLTAASRSPLPAPTLNDQGITGSGFINNYGAVTKSPGSAKTTIASGIAFANNGSLSVQSGWLQIDKFTQ